jgi:hypothetical protein
LALILLAVLRALENKMRVSTKVAVLVLASIGAAVLTFVTLRSALWSQPPWSMAQSYSPPHTEADYPTSFIEARQNLFVSFAPFLCLSSAIAGGFLARSFYAGSPILSRAAAISMAWPAFVFPFVGYFGLFAILFIGIPVVLVAAVLVTAWRSRCGSLDLWTPLANALWSALLYVFSLSWDGVYGD